MCRGIIADFDERCGNYRAAVENLDEAVAANDALRARLTGDAAALGIPLIVPRPSLCTDNGAMIGAAGARRFEAGERSGLDLDARPSLPIASR